MDSFHLCASLNPMNISLFPVGESNDAASKPQSEAEEEVGVVECRRADAGCEIQR